MSGGLLLVSLVGVVLGIVDSTVVQVDKGRMDGLKIGDRARIYYTLTVNDAKKRIDVAEGEITEVTVSAARVKLTGSGKIQAGYSVEFDLTNVRVASPPPEPDIPPSKLIKTDGMVLVPGGRHQIGVNLDKAEYYNQHPSFPMTIEPFWIDRTLVTGQDGRPMTGMSYQEAEEFCERQGKRLPTEFEWEVSATQAVIGIVPRNMSEWTGSWYQPYPGNNIPEPKYGQKFRVVRGPEVRVRYFVNPLQGTKDVGFRCGITAKTLTRQN
jgi:hypothetical protein